MQQVKPSEPREFNYCAWAKTLAAIPALPIIAVIAASCFNGFIPQVIAAFFAVLGAIYLSLWIDRIPCLMRKVRPGKTTL